MISVLISVLLLLCSIQFISCNNWIAQRSRNQFSSVAWPFQPKIGNSPHYQIGTADNFTIDWSVGHGNNAALYGLSSFTYFVMLNYDDQVNIPGTYNEMMALITQYINEAPQYVNDPAAHFVNLTNQPGWTRTQVLPNQWTTTTGKTPNPNFWMAQGGVGMTGVGGYNASGLLEEYYSNNAQLTPQDPNYIYFDPSLYGPLRSGVGFSPYCKVGSLYCSSTLPSGQWMHNPEYLQYDIRYEYINPTLPWIESVSKFQISVSPTDYTNTYNRAYFRIPGRKGPGNYMAWYIWQGYSDIIDVNIQDIPNVASKYGTVSSNAVTYSRVDHCELNFVTNSMTPCRKVNRTTMDITQCIKDCTNAGAGCIGIQVTRASNLAGPYQSTPVNLPFCAYNVTADPTQTMAIGPCGYESVPLRVRAGCALNSSQVGAPRCIASDYLPTDYVCFTTSSIQNQTLQATPAFSNVDEPADPRYYSSCILKGVDYGFPNVPPYPVNPSPWQALNVGVSGTQPSSECIPCSFLNTINNIANTTVPNWENVLWQTSTCEPCN
jgi:hypothetical protein